MAIVPDDNWLIKEAGPFTEVGEEVILDFNTLGWHLDTVYTLTHLQFDGLGGGTVDVQVEGPGGVFVDHDLNKGEGDVTELSSPWKRIKCDFTGSIGDTGRVWVKAYARGF